jgi:hypothetical protein
MELPALGHLKFWSGCAITLDIEGSVADIRADSLLCSFKQGCKQELFGQGFLLKGSYASA